MERKSKRMIRIVREKDRERQRDREREGEKKSVIWNGERRVCRGRGHS